MNRREAIVAGVATIAAAVTFPPAASAQAAITDDNPDLEPKLAFKIIEIKYNPKVGKNFKRILSGAKQVCAQPA